MKQVSMCAAILMLALSFGITLMPSPAQSISPNLENAVTFDISNNVGATTASVYAVAIGDLNNDDLPDILSGSLAGEDYEISVWQNDGTPFDGLWTQNNVGRSRSNVYAVALGDLDKDGLMDAVSGSWSSEGYEILVWKNDGTPFDGLWVKSDVGASTSNVYAVALGDLDGDGFLDIITGSDSGENYEVIAWQNDGTPFDGLWTQNDIGTSSSVTSIAIGDLNKDGFLDIVSGSQASDDYEIISWQNDGTPFDGFWAQNNVGASTDSVHSVALGDLDKDGFIDILTGSNAREDYEVSIWQNDRTPFEGFWTQNNVGTTSDSTRSVALGDLDKDGFLDIVSGGLNGADHELMSWTNDGTPFDGLWAASEVGASPDSVRSVALGDLDNDGFLDILSSSSHGAAYEIVVRQNSGTSVLPPTTTTMPDPAFNPVVYLPYY